MAKNRQIQRNGYEFSELIQFLLLLLLNNIKIVPKLQMQSPTSRSSDTRPHFICLTVDSTFTARLLWPYTTR